MTVYFIHRLNDDSQIKIGSTNNIADRMRRHAAAFGDIKLFAQCVGGVETERLYQKAFSHLRTEGEWFAAADELRDFIAQNADAVDAVFVQGGQTWMRRQASSPSEEDSRIASSLIRKSIAKFPATTTIASAVEEIFCKLHEANKAWSRRRVRAIYDGEARRIDMFEVIDLLNLAGADRSEWPDIISPRTDEGWRAVAGKRISWADWIIGDKKDDEDADR